jgi:uncharacterized protein YprB with RNaseH-like and TPR domain
MSLADKFRALGIGKGMPAQPKPKTDSHSIDSVVAGTFVPTPSGDVFVVEQTYPADHIYGASPLLSSFPLSYISKWANDPALSTLPLTKFAFLDTETSGLSGGTGTYAFLVGVARFIDDRFVLRQYFMRDPAEEPALLEGLSSFLAPCAALITFNGKAFDVPLLSTRYRLHQIPIPYQGYSHLDLLPLARRLWRDRLESRALKFLEEHVLGLTRSSEEVPGFEIPWLYFDYLRTGNAQPLGGVFYHNAMDVVAMAALLAHMNDIMQSPFDGKIQHGLDFVALGKLFEDIGHWDEAARLFERGLELNLTETDFGVAVKRLSILQKRRGDLSEAVRLWVAAAGRGHLYAFIELAKHYEHKERNMESALQWTRSALERLEQMDQPEYIRKFWLAEIERRMERLNRKAGLKNT